MLSAELEAAHHLLVLEREVVKKLVVIRDDRQLTTDPSEAMEVLGDGGCIVLVVDDEAGAGGAVGERGGTQRWCGENAAEAKGRTRRRRDSRSHCACMS